MKNEREAIFLTGATGPIGGLLARRLIQEYPDLTLYALVRDPETVQKLPNVSAVVGDLTKPRLGLSNGVYGTIARSVSMIVHIAASTRLSSLLFESRETNVQGTAHVMELARDCAHLDLFLHVSSTYVAGRRPGALPEALVPSDHGWFSPYEQSKFEAEELLVKEGGTIPWVIVRLSTVIGNSQTGHVSRFNYFHQMVRLIPRNPFAIIPGSPDALVDIVADDFVTNGLLEVMRSTPRRGSVFHLCAGPGHALPAQEVMETIYRSHRQRDSSCSLRAPYFVDVEQFRGLAVRAARSATNSKIAELVMVSLPHLTVHQHFENDKTNRFLAHRGMTPPNVREFLPRVIEACL